jgi:hypothetical protein
MRPAYLTLLKNPATEAGIDIDIGIDNRILPRRHRYLGVHVAGMHSSLRFRVRLQLALQHSVFRTSWVLPPFVEFTSGRS